MPSDSRADALGPGGTAPAREGSARATAPAAPERSGLRRHLRWLLPLLTLAAGAALAAALVATRPVAEANPPEIVPPLVRVVEATPEPLRLSLEAHGTVQPRTESALVSEVWGRVTWVAPAFTEGGFFEAGDPLLRLDDREYRAALERARAQLLRSESQAELARRTLARRRELAASDAVSDSALDEAGNAARVAEAAVLEARAALAQARLELERTTIEAPYAGRVREASADVGQFVNRGTSLGRIYATDYAEVMLPIPTPDLAFVDLPLLPAVSGEPVEGPPVRLEATLGGRELTWTGRIVRTEGEIDPVTRTVQAVVRVDDPFGREAGAGERPPLTPGLFVTARVAGRRVPSATVLPRVAMRDDGHVFVVDEEGRLRWRAVEVLRLERDSVVIGDGLAAGERVLVSPLSAATEGMAVRTAAAVPDDGAS